MTTGAETGKGSAPFVAWPSGESLSLCGNCLLRGEGRHMIRAANGSALRFGITSWANPSC